VPVTSHRRASCSTALSSNLPCRENALIVQ
jgi:hypothetical protein